MAKTPTLEEQLTGTGKVPPAGGPSVPKPPNPDDKREPAAPETEPPVEIGGRKGPDPTRYGDWEINGRCIDF